MFPLEFKNKDFFSPPIGIVPETWPSLSTTNLWTKLTITSFNDIFFKCLLSLVAQMVKNLPAMQETWVQFLGWEDPLEESMATHSSILAWRILIDRGGASWATVHGAAKSWIRLHTCARHVPQPKG